MSEWDKIWWDFSDGTKKPQTYSSLKWTRGSTDSWTKVGGGTATWLTIKNANGEWVFRQKTTGAADRLQIWDGSGDTYANPLIQCEVWPGENLGDGPGILFRLSSAATSATGYLVRLEPLNDEVELLRKTGDGAYTSVSAATVTITHDTRYLLAVAADATRIKVWVNGKLYIDVAESTHTSAGRIGLRGATKCDFKNLLVSEIFTPVSSLTLFESTVQSTETIEQWVAVGPNLVTNGGFESSTTGVKSSPGFDNWSFISAPDVEVVSSPVRAGTRSVKIIDNASADEKLRSNSFDISRFKGYLCEADIQVSGTNDAKITVWLLKSDGTTQIKSFTATTNNSADNAWGHVQVLILPSDMTEDTRKMYIELQPHATASSSGTAYFDNVNIRECLPLVSIPQKVEIRAAEVV